MYWLSIVLKIELLAAILMKIFACSEWVVNQHRDSLASYIGHHNLMEFFAIAENESKARVKFNFLQVNSVYLGMCCVFFVLSPVENVTAMWSAS